MTKPWWKIDVDKHYSKYWTQKTKKEQHELATKNWGWLQVLQNGIKAVPAPLMAPIVLPSQNLVNSCKRVKVEVISWQREQIFSHLWDRCSVSIHQFMMVTINIFREHSTTLQSEIPVSVLLVNSIPLSIKSRYETWTLESCINRDIVSSACTQSLP